MSLVVLVVWSLCSFSFVVSNEPHISKLEISKDKSVIEFEIEDPNSIRWIYLVYGKLLDNDCGLNNLAIPTFRSYSKIQIDNLKDRVCVKLLEDYVLDADYWRVCISNDKGVYSNDLILDVHDLYDECFR